ncbi:SRA-YDG protein [Athelia psychrophila]|uniref:SRA-YDG protein n=1 Tax=Athelia psychrophila TaxID=1759441 RepID=A0A166N5F7_9AGAM|nr:SRA-YDG protein [Fibularhizoctonia sp. CBS 109695]
MAERFRRSFGEDPGLYPFLPDENQDSPFGNRGFDVGKTWPSRQAMCNDKVHSSTFAGISKAGNRLGANAVVLSGKYEDDVDEGDVVWYTGTGGRGTDDWGAASVPQTEDQTFDHPDNAALKTSCEKHYPIRLFRAIPATSGSGVQYRFDGMYGVTKASSEQGKSGFLICQFKFVRQMDQAPLPPLPQ